MKVIGKYIAEDNTEFRDKQACLTYERQCLQIKDALLPLGELPEGTDFTNGGGYIQHDLKDVVGAKRRLLLIAQEICPFRWIDESLAKIETNEIHPSWAGRIISDSGHSALNRAWHRILCIDSSAREWGQPYYVEHPSEAEQICINA